MSGLSQLTIVFVAVKVQPIKKIEETGKNKQGKLFPGHLSISIIKLYENHRHFSVHSRTGDSNVSINSHYQQLQ